MGSAGEAFGPHPYPCMNDGCAAVVVTQIHGEDLQVDADRYVAGAPAYNQAAATLSHEIVRAWWDAGLRVGQEAIAEDVCKRTGEMYLLAELHASGGRRYPTAFARLEEQPWPSRYVLIGDLEARHGLSVADESEHDPSAALGRFSVAAILRYICAMAEDGADPAERIAVPSLLLPVRSFTLEQVKGDGSVEVCRGKETRSFRTLGLMGLDSLLFGADWGRRGSIAYGTVDNVRKELANNYGLPE